LVVESSIGIGALSRETGVHIETIRYYERIGLMAPPPRTGGGHRLYDRDAVRRLGFLRRSRELGFTLDEVRALLALMDGGFTCGQVLDLTERHLADVRARIADLQRLEARLVEISEGCAGGAVPECPVVDALWSNKAG
jgi:MerR family mercuric resistance operon transcriptional regulator|tara:strand:+ start:1588 stop:2001 length:414 start_codon:yes stop_codon:yes gene_type:complete